MSRLLCVWHSTTYGQPRSLLNLCRTSVPEDHRPVKIGPYTFQSTNDPSGLSISDVANLAEITDMLFFLRDDFKIRVASFSAIPQVELDRETEELEVLRNVQAVVAFAYAEPHAVFGNPFLSFENASMVIFTPKPVSIHLLQTDYNVIRAGPPIGTLPEGGGPRC